MDPFFTPTPAEAWDPGAAPDVRIRYNLFPVNVELVEFGLLLAKVRAVITLDEIYLFADSPRGPACVLYARLDDLSPPARVLTVSVHLPDPLTLTVTPTGGCGCGSRLRHFSPFPRSAYARSRSR